ncbi:hypothetical protein BRD00_13045 [Halobacteriales archaeon QS_8_69_26]|nr:MAG: hypothetical protein BRD00_13045 [Halobacteriales archaeon QS_8_69_26]
MAGAVESDEWTWKHASESGDSMTFSISEELDVLDQKSPNLKQRAEQHEENMKDPGYHAKTALSGVAGPLGPLAYQWKATDKAETRSSELGVSGSVSPSIEGSVAEVFGQINASLDTGRNESETLRVADEDGGAWKVWNSPGGNTSLQETATDFGSSSLPRREKLLEVGARTRVTDKTVNSGEVSITVAVGLVYVVGGKIERGQSTSVGGGVGAKGAGVEGAIEWSSKVTHEMGQDDQWDQEFRFVATKGDDE